ncbi:MAG: SDR family NAD(P)-dependent oxidoreductase [Bacillota bacterium]|nr:SDR family NAD(P)-dependent oxidoreductase [Bacillota bacterium]
MKHSNYEKEQIAIIGMGCHLPGGILSPEDFWQLLLNKTDAIIEVPETRWDKRLFFDPDKQKSGKTYVIQGGFLREDITMFDSMFFGISPREAPNIDPQQRMLLEVTYEAIEDAGLQLEALRGKNIGVFVGGFFLDFFLTQFNPLNRDGINMHTATGFSLGNLSNRLSYTFDFKGPSLTIDTACSSSLVALHYACQSIWNNESSLAVVSGVHIMLRPESFISVSKGGFLSRHGRCKSFDIDADGYTRSEGAASVILKPYSKALADGDPIYALIRGTGVNQDGQTPAITIPNGESQEALIRKVCSISGINPTDIHYVEAHGTGTQAGDPVELKAINSVLSCGRTEKEKVLVGSLKSNLGHMEAVAGVSGLIKTALCLKNKMVPPNIHFNTPNPKLDYENLSLKVPTETELLPNDKLSFASVNSFGFGGTNAHVVLEEAPKNEVNINNEYQNPSLSILPLSARSEEALKELVLKYKDFIKANNNSMRDILYSAAKRRSHHHIRLGIVAESNKKTIELLESFADNELVKGIVSNIADIDNPPKIAFVYTGMGPQWWKMGRELMQSDPLFREILEKCDSIFKGYSGWSILEEMLKDERDSRMEETQIAQPANFLIQTALTELLKKFGIAPDAIVGHSVGEVAAMHSSGALSLEDAILVSYHRSRLQQDIAGQGKMLAIGLSETDALKLLTSFPKVSIAAINSFNSVTLAGKENDLLEISKILEEKEVFNRMLKVEVPYHSFLMNPIEQELMTCLQSLKPVKENISVYSTVTGDRINGESVDANYWWNNVRQPVRFAKALTKMIEDGYTVFVEIGPHPVLKNSIKECMLNAGIKGISLQTLNRGEPEMITFYETLANFYTIGVNLDWDQFTQGGKFIQLPRYPWQHEKYEWNETPLSIEDRLGLKGHAFCNKKTPSPNISFEVELNQYLFPFLKDHRVQNTVVFPGAGYVESGIALSNQEKPDSTMCCLENLKFHNMLMIDDKDIQNLNIYIDPKTRDYGVYSRIKNSSSWLQHARGRILPEPLLTNRDNLPPISQLKLNCDEDLNVENFYKDLDRLGLQYYPYFRTVKKIYRGDKNILARIEVHESIEDIQNYFLHPTLLDGGIQTLAALFDKLVIPVKIGSVNFYSSPGSNCWSYLEITDTTQISITGNLYLIDENGRVFAELLDLECQRVPIDESWKNQILDSWIYDIKWEETQMPDHSTSGSYWLIFANESSKTRYIAESLTNSNQQFKLIDLGKDYSNVNSYEAISDITKDLNGKKVTHILYLADLQATDDKSSVITDTINASMPIIYLVQAFSKILEEESLKIGIVTLNANLVTGNEVKYNLLAGSLLGMNRLINNEHMNILCKNIDMDEIADTFSGSLIINEMLSENSDDDIAYRSGARYVKRIDHTSIGKDQKDQNNQIVSADITPVELIVGMTGNPDSLYYREMSRTMPTHGEMEIQVHGCSLYSQDAAEIMGRIPPRTVYTPEMNQALGVECHGVVTNIGPDVAGYHIGDEVIAFVGNGCIKSFITVNQNDYIMAKPKLPSSNASINVIPFTAAVYILEYICHIEKGTKILVHNAASDIGQAIIQLAQKKEADIFATAINNDQIDYLKSIGVSHVLDLNSFEFINKILDITDQYGVDVIISNLSGEKRTQSLKLLAPYGNFIQFGKTDNSDEIKISNPILSKNITISTVDIDSLYKNKRIGNGIWNKAHEYLSFGYLRPIPMKTFDAQDIGKALDTVVQPEHIGGVYLNIKDSKVILKSENKKELIKPDSTYLITGGTRGLGLEIAKWLVSNGADNLVLLSRSGAERPEAKEAISSFEKSGVNVIVRAIDISDFNCVEKLITDISASLPPIRGIFHGAMVLDDGFIVDMNKNRYEKVMLPKVAGAYNLHVTTLSHPLDFFISFSSIATLIGNTGQVNYVAANSFLESFSRYRKSMNLPATTVNLGVLSEVGVTSRNSDVLTLLEQSGISGMSVEQVLSSLEIIMEHKPIQVGLFKVDWKNWSQKNPGTAKSSRFNKLVSSNPEEEEIPEHLKIHLETMIDMDSEGRNNYVENLLVKELAAVLRLSVEKINKKRPVMDQGIDSLMTVELKSRFSELFAAPLSTTLFFNYPTIEKLAEYFLKNVIKFDILQKETTSNEDENESSTLNDLEELLNRVNDKD